MAQLNTQGKGLRFGCGFIFGLSFGAVSFGLAFHSNGAAFVAVTIVTAFVCGFCALVFGNSFWRSMRKFWFWWV